MRGLIFWAICFLLNSLLFLGVILSGHNDILGIGIHDFIMGLFLFFFISAVFLARQIDKLNNSRTNSERTP